MPEVVLGIDYGTKHIGLAIGQTLTRTAQPYRTILNNKTTFDTLNHIISEWQISTIILGLPLDMDGQQQEITRQVKNFEKKVRHYCQRPIHLVDERLTSYEAERFFQQKRNQQQAKAKDKKMIDALAAQIILQSWFDQL